MISNFVTLIRAAQKGIIFDTNLMLLHLLGNYDRTLIGCHKRLNTYTVDDFNILTQILKINPKLALTPHTLTEVCNLCGSDDNKSKADWLKYFQYYLTHKKERRPESSFLMNKDSTFIKFGLADCALVDASKNGYTIITNDLGCYMAIQQASGKGINFAHIQSAVWFAKF